MVVRIDVAQPNDSLIWEAANEIAATLRADPLVMRIKRHQSEWYRRLEQYGDLVVVFSVVLNIGAVLSSVLPSVLGTLLVAIIVLLPWLLDLDREHLWRKLSRPWQVRKPGMIALFERLDEKTRQLALESLADDKTLATTVGHAVQSQPEVLLGGLVRSRLSGNFVEVVERHPPETTWYVD
jgi:hypothetical protein